MVPLDEIAEVCDVMINHVVHNLTHENCELEVKSLGPAFIGFKSPRTCLYASMLYIHLECVLVS